MKWIAIVFISFGLYSTYAAAKRHFALLNLGSFIQQYEEDVLTGNISGNLQKLYPALWDHGLYLIYLGRAHNIDSNHLDAVNVLSYAIKITPNKDAYYELGQAYEALGNFEKAKWSYLQVANSHKYLIKPYFLLAKLKLRAGDCQEFRYYAGIVEDFQSKFKNREILQMKTEIKALEAACR